MAMNKEDILDALGIESGSSWFFTAWPVSGSAAWWARRRPMLLAPKSGSELREDLMARGRGLVQRGREQVAEGKPPIPPTY